MLLTWGVLSHLYYTVKQHRAERSIHDQLWIHIPISLFHSATTILVVVVAFATFGIKFRDPTDVWGKASVLLGLLSLEVASEAYAFQPSGGDVAANMTITSWLFFTLVYHASSEFGELSGLVFGILSLLGAINSTCELVLGPQRTSLLQTVSTVAYIVLLGWNIFVLADTHTLPLANETYFTLAPYGFIAWQLIQLLLLGCIVYQFTDSGRKTIVRVIGWRFPLLITLGCVHVYVSQRDIPIAAFVTSLLVWCLLWDIHGILKCHPAENTHDWLWIHIPISMWHAWMAVLVVVSGFEASGLKPKAPFPVIPMPPDSSPPEWYPRGPDPASSAADFFMSTELLALVVLSVVYGAQGDLAANLVLIWSLIAIYVHQDSSFANLDTLIPMALSMPGLAMSAVGVLHHRRPRWGAIWLDEEESTGLSPVGASDSTAEP